MIQKRNILLLFLAILMTCFSANAQQKIQWGDPIKNNTKSVLEKIITQDANGFFVLKTRQGRNKVSDGPQKVYIERYDLNMNLRKAKELNLKWKKNKRQFENILMIGGELYLFTSYNNLAKRKNFLFAQKINKQTFNVENKLNYVAEIDTRGEFKEGTFKFHISRDSSKVLVLNQLPYKKNQPEQFALHVYNNDFTLSWEKNIVLPYNDNQFEIEDYQIDNDGNVYLLGVLYGDKVKARRRGLPNYQYILLSYRNLGENRDKYPIKIREKFITDLTFRPSNTGELVFCGFYSEHGTYSIKGTYFFRLNPETKEMSNQSLKELDFDFRTEYVSSRKKDRIDNDDKRAELYQFSLDDLILRNDGGALLVAEQYFVEEIREYDPFVGGVGRFDRFGNNNFRLSYIYNYNDIIVVNVGPDGDIEWASRIPKRQETQDDGGWYSSYSMSIVRDKINFIYNENGRNFDVNIDDRRRGRYNFNGRNSVIALSQVNPDGSVTTTPLGQNRQAGVITRPKTCKQIGPDTIAIYGENGKFYRFGKVVF